jgi:serine protease
MITVREYFNSSLNHYFITASTEEMNAIESGRMGAGWSATGFSFRAYPAGSSAPANSWPVCRFYGSPGVGPNSHFYTVNPYECAATSRDDGWWYEGLVFNVQVPLWGSCDLGTEPVYRAYNGRWAQNDSNHRYLTSRSEYQRMLALGWQAEGVVMCAPIDVQTNSAH